MIAHYTTPEAIALLDRIGWPEWAEGDETVRLRGELVAGQGWYSCGYCISRPVALCLLRNHLREYAEKAGIWIDARINQAGQVEYFVYDNRGGTDQGDDCFVDSFVDYDEALLAACKQALAE